jgi:hypothetical protein
MGAIRGTPQWTLPPKITHHPNRQNKQNVWLVRHLKCHKYYKTVTQRPKWARAITMAPILQAGLPPTFNWWELRVMVKAMNCGRPANEPPKPKCRSQHACCRPWLFFTWSSKTGRTALYGGRRLGKATECCAVKLSPAWGCLCTGVLTEGPLGPAGDWVPYTKKTYLRGVCL